MTYIKTDNVFTVNHSLFDYVTLCYGTCFISKGYRWWFTMIYLLNMVIFQGYGEEPHGKSPTFEPRRLPRGFWTQAPKPNAGPHKLRECLPLIAAWQQEKSLGSIMITICWQSRNDDSTLLLIMTMIIMNNLIWLHHVNNNAIMIIHGVAMNRSKSILLSLV